MTIRGLLNAIAALILILSSSQLGFAESIKLVTFGDSAVVGMGRAHKSGLVGGVNAADAFPAKLERALRARRWDVSVLDRSVPGRSAGAAANALWEIPPDTQIVITHVGGIDQLAHASGETVAGYLNSIIDKLHARGCTVIVDRSWFGPSSGAYDAAGRRADAYTHWWQGLNIAPVTVRPEYDAGDGEHLNDAATDIVVSRAVPDIERVLVAKGFRPGA